MESENSLVGRFLRYAGRLTLPPFHLSGWYWVRLGILLAADFLLVLASYYGAFVLRLEAIDLGRFQYIFLSTAPIVVMVHGAVFYVGGMYRQVWRYANASSALLVAGLTALASLIAFVLIFTFVGDTPPRSVPFVHFLLASMVIGFEKFSWRSWAGLQVALRAKQRESCLIYGAGQAGELFARHVRANPNFPYKPVGFLDDDPNKRGRLIYGLRIRGSGNDLIDLCQQFNVKVVILAMPSASGRVVREIVDNCSSAEVKPLIMPDISDVLGHGKLQPRAVDVKDLLRRTPKSVDEISIASFLNSRTVLVTGAGGSIGSEICRQVLARGVARLVMVDSSEFNLVRLERELQSGKTTADMHFLLASVTDKAQIDRIVRQFHPSCILHAAAYKHVPAVERNAAAGVLNNIMGTKNLAEVALAHGVSHFILISTDKAVRPANVMGASKRCCELLIQAMQALNPGRTCFSAVRFGNVLGSSGSVIPLFCEQIESGGPVTVTHPEITRYFMLTSEAVGLVLQAAACASGGEIFVLNMGEPVNVYDMAKQLIRLSGKEPGRDIEIVFSGLRPGEKLYEELILEGTEKTTVHDDIFIAVTDLHNAHELLSNINAIIAQAQSGNDEAMIEMLRCLACSSDGSVGSAHPPGYVASVSMVH